ncbi:MAG: T9SS type A sorting domain-containing protein [Candidatus Kapabacteria bacterium]|nr:T9SS type A sorting domain-containing protein [Candidatus Kapabacteria bacterium]
MTRMNIWRKYKQSLLTRSVRCVNFIVEFRGSITGKFTMGHLQRAIRAVVYCSSVCFIVVVAEAQFASFHPMLQSIGIQISDVQGIDSCTVMYRRQGSDQWLQGFRPDEVTIGGKRQFRGSLFLLEPATEYEISIRAFLPFEMLTLPIERIRTLEEPTLPATSAIIRWVSPGGSGSAYTRAQPGNLASLLSQQRLACGTTIMLMDGIYRHADLRLTPTIDCQEQSPIVMMAAQGARPIFDGGISLQTTWSPHPNDSKLFWTVLPSEAAYSTVCRLGSRTLYPYPSLGAEPLLGGYNLASLSFGYDGFVRDDRTIWIKTADGVNPNDSLVMLATAHRFMTVLGNGQAARLMFRGITFRHYGRPLLNPLGSEQDSYPAAAFDIRNTHQLTFDSCRFEYCTAGIVLNGQCDDITIQNCSFTHRVGTWSHAMIKKSHDALHTLLLTVASSRGRAVESPAVFIDQGSRLIIRRNHFEGVNSGIDAYFDKGLKQEVDVSDNVFIDNFDAIECDGLWCNLRAWNNTIIRPMAGISAAPPLIGPRTFYRNVITGMGGRRAEADDVYFVECFPVGSNYRNQGLAIKTNSGYQGGDARGNLYFLNNTFHAEDSLGFVITSERAEWRSAMFVNNSITHGRRNPLFFFDLGNRDANAQFEMTSINDNYFSYEPGAPVAIAQHIYGQYRCTPIGRAGDLQSTLSEISGSPKITVHAPFQLDPLFIKREGGSFELSASSPLIDAGRPIPGFYDYTGVRPDVGAHEYGSISSIRPDDNEGLSVYPHPVSERLHIRHEESTNDAQISVLNLVGQSLLSEPCTSPECNIDMGTLPAGAYIVRIHSALRGTRHIRVVKY